MKICPFLWQPLTDGSGTTQGAPEAAAAGAAEQECLRERCRFFTADARCGLEVQLETLAELRSHVTQGEDRWEDILLSLVELTERLEAAITRSIGLANPEVENVVARQKNEEGIAHYRAGDLQKALLSFAKAVELAPEYVDSLNNLGLVETERQDYEDAIEHFRKAISLNPELATSYTNLGYVFYRQGNYLDALAMYVEAVRRAEGSSSAWTNLGNAQFKLGKVSEAREAWQRALKLDPDNSHASVNLAQISQKD